MALCGDIENGQSQLASSKAEDRKLKDLSRQLERDIEKSSKLIQVYHMQQGKAKPCLTLLI